MEHFTFMPLLPGVDIAFSREHPFTTDSVLLARFAAPKSRERACDLCCGGGIVPLLWCGGEERGPASAVGLDLNGGAVALFDAAIVHNSLSERLTALVGDLRDLPPALGRGGFDLVTCNPPYFLPGAEPSPRRHARQELDCTLAEVTAAAASLLRFGGRFCLCHRPERLTDLLCALRAAGLEPKRLLTVCRRPGKAPWLLLVEARRGGRPGLHLLPPLALENPDGQPSAAYRKLYRMR